MTNTTKLISKVALGVVAYVLIGAYLGRWFYTIACGDQYDRRANAQISALLWPVTLPLWVATMGVPCTPPTGEQP